MANNPSASKRILINNRKVSGLIAEVVGNGVVIGIGINVGMSEDQLPVETATSLLIEGGVDLNVYKGDSLDLYDLLVD